MTRDRSGTQKLGPGTGMLATDAGGSLVLRRVVLRVVTGEDRGKEHLLEQGTCLIGSHPDADLVLRDGTVSRYHAEVVLLPEGVRVRDLRSTNGTFVGDSRIEAAIVVPGSEIRLGRARIECLPADVPVPEAPSELSRFGRLVGASPRMRRLYAQLERLASVEVPALIWGEAGVGKNEAARSLHEASPRGGPFIELHLASGFHPTAVDDAFARAMGGTLVLDHLDGAPGAMQDALAHALDRRERELWDVRPLALARDDLRAQVEEGQIRRDIYFALANVRVEVPPLRERREDLPWLVKDLLQTLGYPDFGLGPAELATLRGNEFPGNVRELRRMIEESLLKNESPRRDGGEDVPAVTAELSQLPFKEAKERLLDTFERSYVADLLERFDGNVSRAAQEAGIDRNHLSRLARKHGLR